MQQISKVPAEDIVWIDESGIDEHLYRKYARKKRGERVYYDVPGKRISRTSVIAAYNGKKLKAPMYFRGYTNTEVFNTWVEKCLLPTLKKGQVVVADNASFHKSKKTKELIESVGCILMFQPKYSPDLNEIEPQWANLKQNIESDKNQKLNFFQKLEKHIINLGNHIVS